VTLWKCTTRTLHPSRPAGVSKYEDPCVSVPVCPSPVVLDYHVYYARGRAPRRTPRRPVPVMPRVRCAGHVMTCGACSCFNLGNSLPVALGPACARTDTTMTTEDRCTTAAVCMHISYAAHQTSTSAHFLATFGSRHALLGDLAPANPWSRMDSAATFSHYTSSGFSSTVCIARHTQTFWVVVLAPRADQLRRGLWIRQETVLGRSAPFTAPSGSADKRLPGP
jgi:hypothetical protein